MNGDCTYLVRTFCATYNQEHYIKDALQGFVMQETTFPVVYSIVDDASTDRNPEVIREFVKDNFDLQNTSVAYEKDADYGHVTFAQHKTNKNCYFAVIYLKENHYSQKKSRVPYLTEWMNTKYIALCEGDDYWTDPLKLQKQVDFLETHEDFMLCFHSVMIQEQSRSELLSDDLSDVPEETGIRDLAVENYIHTPSVVYRKDPRADYEYGKITGASVGDYLKWLLCAEYGKLYKIKEPMAVYRKGVGVWTGAGMTNEKRTLEWIVALAKLSSLIKDPVAKVILDKQIKEYKDALIGEIDVCKKERLQVCQSFSYRVGKSLVRPFAILKRLCVRYR